MFDFDIGSNPMIVVMILVFDCQLSFKMSRNKKKMVVFVGVPHTCVDSDFHPVLVSFCLKDFF